MRVDSRATRTVLTAGAVVSAACFVVAIVLEFLGRSTASGDPLDVSAIVDSVVGLRPWGWATLGVLAVIITPAAGLMATAREFRGTREALLALVVLGILGVSLIVALVR